ncbi:MAG: MiaB/RimO family radical SAM methylthiotransferase [Candidatus Gracilibacteria bacterium]|nr:MiaB/RimO family radical SAM methylthiotransferase [Candidatus Gracilibacteria bacterium]
MTFKFASINLGCNKNLVDLEFTIGEILKFSDRINIEYFEDPEDENVDHVIINTCGFLSTAREESEQTIKYFDDLGKKIIILGCYISVKNDEFLSSLKNLYKIIPFVNYSAIEDLLFDSKNSKISLNKDNIQDLKKNLKENKLKDYLEKIGGSQLDKKAFIWKGDETRAYINAPFGYEYLKIAEGCDNNCTFCIIPKIRGRQKSRPIVDIISEVNTMISYGIKEIEIIAQDTTRYGADIYDSPKLIELLEEIEKIGGDFKYRLLYMYPDNLSLATLEKLKSFKRFIPYFDIPFQHISEKILKRMGRYYNTSEIHNFLDYIKSNFEDYHLRTAFIIGFPGETDEDQNILLDFLEKYEFDSVALFQYHDEPLAPSFKLDGKIEDSVSAGRVNEADELIQKIYDKKQKNDKGKTFSGYVMDFDSKKAIIRRELKAPEIDEYDEVKMNKIIKTEDFDIGSFVEYRV